MLKKLLCLSVLCISIALSIGMNLAASSKNTQERKITSRKRHLAGEFPYQITNIVINGAPIEMDSSFSVGSTGDEWEKKLTFNFVNTSNKDITYVFIELQLPSPDGIKLGAHAPFFWFRSRTAGSVLPFFRDVKSQEMFRDVPDFKPGDILQIKLQEKYYNDFQRVLGMLGLSNSGEIKDFTIWVKTVGFSDGTIWEYGQYFKLDPKDPKKWVPAEKGMSLGGVDERGSSSLSSPSSQAFCGDTHALEADEIECLSPTGGDCFDVVEGLSHNPGKYSIMNYFMHGCINNTGIICDYFPEPVFDTCP